MQLEPVDFDPFASSGSQANSGFSLEPVDHDPFAATTSPAAKNEPWAANPVDALSHVIDWAHSFTDAPGNAKQIAKDNREKWFPQTLAEGLPRGAEEGTLSLMQHTGLDKALLGAYGMLNPDSGVTAASAPDASADVAKNIYAHGKDSGIGGAIGEGVIDPRYAALMAAGVAGKLPAIMAAPDAGVLAKTAVGVGNAGIRGLEGATMGATNATQNPLDITNISPEAKAEIEKNAGNTALGFAAIPPLVEGAGKIMGGLKEGAANLFGGAKDINGAGQDTYDKVAQKFQADGKSPEQIMDAAQKLQDTVKSMTGDNGNRAAIPTTLPEELESKWGLSKQRTFGELSNQAGQDFQKFNDNRFTNAIPTAKEDFTQDIAQGAPQTLTDAGERTQFTANNIVKDAIKARTDAAQPAYESIKNSQLPEEAIMKLRSDPTIEEMYQKVLGDPAAREQTYNFKKTYPELEKLISPQMRTSMTDADIENLAQKAGMKPVLQKELTDGLPEDSVGIWNQVKSQLGKAAKGQNPYAEMKNNDQRLAGSAASSIRGILEDKNFNPTADTYKTTNEEYIANSKEIQDLMNSPVGKIAKAGNSEAAAKMVMSMSREQLNQLMPALEAKDPNATRGLAGAILNEYTDKSDSGNIAKYVRAFDENPIVRDKMRALLGDDAADAQQEIIKTLRKVQAGQPGGSPTNKNAYNVANPLDEDNRMGLLQKMVTPVKSLTTGVTNAISSRLNATKQAEMMNIFTNPDLDKLGKALNMIPKGNENARSQMVQQWLSNTLARRDDQGKQTPQPKTPQAPLRLNISPPLPHVNLPEGAPPPQATQPAVPTASAAPAAPATTGGDALKNMIAPISQQFGNDPALMHKIAMQESGGNPNAKNPASTAMGLYGIEAPTWRNLVQQYGPSLGVSMRDRVDPVKNTIMANALMKENRNMLQKTLGREPTGGELYLAHFLGAGDTQKLLRNLNNNQITAARLMPAAAQSNPTKFFDKGRPLTPAEVYKKVTASVGV